ncbi:TetR/AcrR family transcriptional regulator [Streptacidiphilus sp. PB12-B1b]|uniref:TetR/AcrR family transcriptional regulator n=1 Tax=Streptacidiphilus sp. PB12-B1b TaxID=2705012 RepID=UPI0015FCE817|nr:TetR/AcrR family transcriptional regulator [Streptacidiphilus sp. PB12-B1b]QMU79610.1 TetR/AcrR family transcriptional regulator [Streptacidiphilus sp. PB12-B1b]
MHPEKVQSPQRRRGTALEEALLAAAWAVLRENGYAGFTLEAVATHAGTSRPVLARRWASRNDLLHATITHAGVARTSPVPDTGSLRGDLIALLHEVNDSRLDFATVLGVQLGGYYQETGETLSDLREVLLRGQEPVLEQILAAAVERGEADPDRLTPRIRSLPMDLLRHHALMTFQAMPDDGIEDIVDTIFLPLVSPARSERTTVQPGS